MRVERRKHIVVDKLGQKQNVNLKDQRAGLIYSERQNQKGDTQVPPFSYLS